jgi:hypothetical protein
VHAAQCCEVNAAGLGAAFTSEQLLLLLNDLIKGAAFIGEPDAVNLTSNHSQLMAVARRPPCVKVRILEIVATSSAVIPAPFDDIHDLVALECFPLDTLFAHDDLRCVRESKS